MSANYDLDGSDDWHELLNRMRCAERDRDLLIDEVLRDHDAGHGSAARWCDHLACRMAGAQRRR